MEKNWTLILAHESMFLHRMSTMETQFDTFLDIESGIQNRKTNYTHCIAMQMDASDLYDRLYV